MLCSTRIGTLERNHLPNGRLARVPWAGLWRRKGRQLIGRRKTRVPSLRRTSNIAHEGATCVKSSGVSVVSSYEIRASDAGPRKTTFLLEVRDLHRRLRKPIYGIFAFCDFRQMPIPRLR